MTESRREVLRGVKILPTTHAGLWLDSYLGFQTGATDEKDSDEVKSARMKVIEEVANNGAPEGYLKASEDRALSLLNNPERTIRDVRIYRTDGRTIVGLGQKGVIEAGITLERTWGVPILPGSSLKGVAAATAHLLTDNDSWRKAPNKDSKPGESFAELFGTTEDRGTVIFHDAWWLPKEVSDRPLAQDIMTVHHPKYYQNKFGDKDFQVPDGTDSPNPVSFVTTTSGLAFVFCLEAQKGDEAWLDAAWRLLDKGLSELGVGAKTNSGYGRLTFDEIATKSLKATSEKIAKDHLAKKAFGSGDASQQFKVLFDSLLITRYSAFITELSGFDGQNPYTLFKDSSFAGNFPNPTPHDAMEAFRKALSEHPVFGPALLKGQQIQDVQMGSSRLKELGQKLGLTSNENKPEVETAEKAILKRAAQKDSWVDATKAALADTSLPRQVYVQLKVLSKSHFGSKLKGEKLDLVTSLDARMGELNK